MAPVAIITLCQCRFITKAAADNIEIEINGCDCIPIKLSLLTLEVELHIIFTELEYYSNFTFFSAIKNVKKKKKSQHWCLTQTGGRPDLVSWP